jgi:hypothetical protein
MRHLLAGNKLTPEMIRDVNNSLTEEELVVANWLEQRYAQAYDEVDNIVYMVEKRHLGKVKRYSPLYSAEKNLDGIQLGEGAIESVVMNMLENTGQKLSSRIKEIQERRKGMHKVQLNAFNNYVKYIEDTEHYKAIAPVVKELAYLFNDNRVSNLINTKLGKDGTTVMKNWLQDVASLNPFRPVSWSERLLKGLRLNATASILGFHVVVSLKQAASWATGVAEVGEGAALRGLLEYGINNKEIDKLISKYAPQIAHRNMDLEIWQMSQAKNIEKRLAHKLSNKEVFSFFAVFMDKIAVRSLWAGEFYKQLNITPEDPQGAADKATRAIQKTQAYFGAKDVAEAYRSGEFMRSLLAFTNEINNHWNYYREIYGKTKYGRIPITEAAREVFWAVIITGLLISLLSRGKGWKNLKEAGSEVGANVLQHIPLLGNAFAGLLSKQFYNSDLITLQAGANIVDAFRSFSEKKYGKGTADLLTATGQAIGIPTISTRRSIETIIKLAENNTNDWAGRVLWGEYTRKEVRGEKYPAVDPLGNVIPSVTEFYEKFKKLNTMNQELKKAKNQIAYAQYINNHPEIRYYGKARNTLTQIDNARQRQKDIAKSNLPREQIKKHISAINKQIESLARNFMNLYGSKI